MGFPKARKQYVERICFNDCFNRILFIQRWRAHKSRELFNWPSKNTNTEMGRFKFLQKETSPKDYKESITEMVWFGNEKFHPIQQLKTENSNEEIYSHLVSARGSVPHWINFWSKFWIRSLEGERFDSRKEKSPYVISFFFVNCIPCIKEIPELYKFMNTNFPNVPLLFIDPIKEDSKKDIQRFSEKLKVPSSYFYKDSFGTISKKFFKGTCLFLLLLV